MTRVKLTKSQKKQICIHAETLPKTRESKLKILAMWAKEQFNLEKAPGISTVGDILMLRNELLAVGSNGASDENDPVQQKQRQQRQERHERQQQRQERQQQRRQQRPVVRVAPKPLESGQERYHYHAPRELQGRPHEGPQPEIPFAEARRRYKLVLELIPICDQDDMEIREMVKERIEMIEAKETLLALKQP